MAANKNHSYIVAMCLAVPVRVIEVCDGDWAVVDLGGVTSRVSLAFVEDVSAGDYVIVHVGHAIARLDVAQAEESLALFREIADSIGLQSDALYTRVS
jgi:hydrogenase expression/formation protein HypC